MRKSAYHCGWDFSIWSLHQSRKDGLDWEATLKGLEDSDNPDLDYRNGCKDVVNIVRATGVIPKAIAPAMDKATPSRLNLEMTMDTNNHDQNSTEYWVQTKLELALADAKKGRWKSCFEQANAACDYLWTSGLCVKEDNIGCTDGK
jgi:hypothetical protein